jgi:hypothetical protein
VLSSCLLVGRSAFQWSDCDFQTLFIFEQLPFCWSVSGPMGGMECSESVLW